LAHADLNKVPIVFFANKMDLPTAITPVECCRKLELEKIVDKPWHIAASNGLTGEGVDAGINWLGEQMVRLRSTRR
jgi:ADP-ribosylation factor-like protein 6